MPEPHHLQMYLHLSHSNHNNIYQFQYQRITNPTGIPLLSLDVVFYYILQSNSIIPLKQNASLALPNDKFLPSKTPDKS